MTINMPPNPSKASVNRTANTKLETDGFAVSGNIPHHLISRLPQHQLTLSSIHKRFERQIELFWTPDCDAVVDIFENDIKPHLNSIENKLCVSRRFIYLHGKPSASGVYRLNKYTGRYIVMIIAQTGAGLPLVCRGSHTIPENENLDRQEMELVELPKKEGNAVIMHAGLAIEDPAVGVDGMEGLGAWCVVLVY